MSGSFPERVKDLGIEIDLSILSEIKENMISQYRNHTEKYKDSPNSMYDTEKYIKSTIYDNIKPLIFNDFEESWRFTSPGHIMHYDDFLKTDEDYFNFTTFIADLNTKLQEHYGGEVLFRLEFTMLAPGQVMHKHRDHGRHLKHRLNLLFEDDDKSGFQCGDMIYPMKKNKIYHVDVTKLHRAVNYSDKYRYAIIFDLITNFSDFLEYKMELFRKFYKKTNNQEKWDSFEKLYDYFMTKDTNGRFTPVKKEEKIVVINGKKVKMKVG